MDLFAFNRPATPDLAASKAERVAASLRTKMRDVSKSNFTLHSLMKAPYVQFTLHETPNELDPWLPRGKANPPHILIASFEV